MFQSLTDRLSGVLDKLTRRGALTESDVAEAMREVRRALLEADVALDVVKDFVEKVKAKAVGQEVVKSVTPGQMVVKIVNDELVAMLGSTAEPIDLHAAPPVAILMVGLQGSGKTTTTAKIAYRLTNRERKKVLMASLDTRRPAAQEQLRVLGEPDRASRRCRSSPARRRCRLRGAPRKPPASAATMSSCSIPPAATSIDEELMGEVAEIEAATHPHEVLLVADSLTGQDAVNTAKALRRPRRHHRHRADACRRRWPRRRCSLDARRHRQADQADRRRREVGRAGGLPPRPRRRAASSAWATSSASSRRPRRRSTSRRRTKIAEKMKKGAFDLDDLSEQLKQMQQIGGMGGVMGMIPGIAKIKGQIEAAAASTTRS